MRLADMEVDVPDLLHTLNIEVVKERDNWADACCPLHPERNPSFSIRTDTGRWICRHGDIKGDALDLVVRLKGISPGEAVKYIKGLPLMDPGMNAVFDAIARINGTTVLHHDGDLPDWDRQYQALDPTVMSDYWWERGFDETDMLNFEVRFDPNEERLVWPVRDENANLIGYTARKLPGSFGQKYLYPKSFQRHLFPLNWHSGEDIVLVEGPLDAMWLHKHGINGQALLGSSVTKLQKAWLFAHVRRIVVLGDNDPAGARALSGLVRSLSGFDVRFAFVPEHRKDPQDCTKAELYEALESTWNVTQAVINGLISFIEK